MKKLIRGFNYIVVAFPFAVAFLFALVYYTGGWGRWDPSHDLTFYFEYPLTEKLAVLLLYLLLFSCFCAVVYLLRRYLRNGRNRRSAEMILVGLIAFSLRLAVVLPNSGQLSPFSDFWRTWQIAHYRLEGHINYYTVFPAYLNFSELVRRFLLLVGDHFEYTLYANAVLSSLTAVLIYLSTVQIKRETAFTAGLLYAMMPANILYNAVMTPEFLTIFLYMLGIVSLLLAAKWGGWRRLALSLLAGVLFGASASFKQFAIVIIIAAVMCGATGLILERAGRRNVIAMVLACLFLLCGYRAAQSVILNDTEKQLGVTVDDSAAVVHFLSVGLNTEGEGQIHVGSLSRTFWNQISAGTELGEAKKTTIEMLKADWAEHADRIPALLAEKMIWAWQDDTVPVYYYNVARGLPGDPIETWHGFPLSTLTQTFYMATMLFGLAGAFLVAKNRKIDLKVEFVLLVIFGYFCLILLSEAQSRYKCLVMPFICMLAAIGMTGQAGKGRDHA